MRQDHGAVPRLTIDLLRDCVRRFFVPGGVVAVAMLTGEESGRGGFSATRRWGRVRPDCPGGAHGELAVSRRRQLVSYVLVRGYPAVGRSDLRGGCHVASPGAVMARRVRGSVARAVGDMAILVSLLSRWWPCR